MIWFQCLELLGRNRILFSHDDKTKGEAKEDSTKAGADIGRFIETKTSG